MLSDAALKLLTGFSFPGNVRQLENLCHWLTVMAPGQRVDVADLPAELREPATGAEGAGNGEVDWQSALDRELSQALARGEHGVGDRLLREFKRTLILRSLAHTGGHRLEAAQWLGWGRNTLTRKIQELGLEPELRKAEARPLGPVTPSPRARRSPARGPTGVRPCAHCGRCGRTVHRAASAGASRMWSMRKPRFFGNASIR